ncbi:MAG: TonB family protein [Pseudomonadota bacterium]
MKIFSQLSPLSIAVAVSVMAHGALLAVRFAAPDAFHFKPSDPGLEVILVNAKHARAPLKAEVLAQADLDGGGNADKGRSKSPLPDLHRTETGDSLKAIQKRAADLEEYQKSLVTSASHSPYKAPPIKQYDKLDPNRTGTDIIETSKAIARKEAEIFNRIEDENERPHKSTFSPKALGVKYAQYYSEMAHRIEEVGTLNFPQKDGRKMYGQVVISIPVFQDGAIYDKEGGITVEKSSGNAALDKAAVAIVRRSAPFGRFPPKMMSSREGGEVFVIVCAFNFARNNKLEAEIGGAK